MVMIKYKKQVMLYEDILVRKTKIILITSSEGPLECFSTTFGPVKDLVIFV